MWFQENIHTPPHRRDWKFRGGGGGGGVLKGQKFKAMYEAKLEFLEGWGDRANPFHRGGGGGMDIFWNHTISHLNQLKCATKF